MLVLARNMRTYAHRERSARSRAERRASPPRARSALTFVPEGWLETWTRMVVEGLDGQRLGTVERFEIDEAGRLTNVVVRLGARRGACKRIAAQHIKSVGAGMLTLALSAAEVMRQTDVTAAMADELLLENMRFFPDLR
jgi:hypothetical protein